ncbi:MAG TPA: PCP reductase family protein [Nitrospiria bacterium]|nr:PCP reductase family protein [Nitrospiria bacterium]
MKFVCRKCETFMLFEKLESPAEASLGITFECPECGSRFSMVTNPGETSMVQALGVKLGGRTEPAGPMELTRETLKEPAVASDAASTAAGASAGGSGGKCPFSSMISGMQQPGAKMEWSREALERMEQVPSFVKPMLQSSVENYARANGITLITPAVMDASKNAPTGMAWAPEAEKRLENIPSFVRPMARKEIERIARDRGLTTVTAALMDEAKDKFMSMGI